MTDDEARRRSLRNLQAVARHRIHGSADDDSAAAAEPTGKSRGRSKLLKSLGPIGIVAVFVLGKLKLLIPERTTSSETPSMRIKDRGAFERSRTA